MGMTLARLGRYVAAALLIMAGLSACSPLVFIPDKALEAAVRVELGKPLSLFLTKADLEKIDRLSAPAKNISSLEGLQYCTNLRELDLRDNKVTRIDALSRLTKMTYLHLGNNNISNIEAISGLLFLEYLNLSGANNAIMNWSYLRDNVVNGGLGAESVAIVPRVYCLDGDGNPLPGFQTAFAAMSDAGVIVQFID